ETTSGLGLAHALAETLDQAAERRVLLDLNAQVADAGFVERLAIAVVDLELAGAENLECLFQRLRTTLLAGAHAACSLARRGRCGCRRYLLRGCARRGGT